MGDSPALNTKFTPNCTDRFHFIGIGGIGMSAIAYILVKRGYQVSGSDINSNRGTDQLQKLGVTIYHGQSAENIDLNSGPQVVYSSAIKPNNPELQIAQAHNLTLWHRSDLLARLIKEHHSIAVAGTHGKTTTSSLVAFLLLQGGLDPTIIVGGEVEAWSGNARVGNGTYLVAEADESDGSFVKFYPHVGVVTNIELDHPDHYHSLEEVIHTFQEFASHCQVLVACLDCPTTKAVLTPHITYSLHDRSADYTVKAVYYGGDHTKAVLVEKGEVLGEFRLHLLGAHNLSNALASIAIARHLGLDWQTIQTALPQFQGAKRRFEVRAQCQGITLVDDYAHHPSELKVTLSAAKLQGRRVIAVFQPHRYSRTHALLDQFATAFDSADMVVITDIYGAGETKLDHLSGHTLAELVKVHHPQVYYCPLVADVPQFLQKYVCTGDLVLFLGAGNLNQAIAPTAELLHTFTQAQLNA
jgi:UDP-N-acetylmuramate--alanine ligase